MERAMQIFKWGMKKMKAGSMILMPVIVRLLRETECMHAILIAPWAGARWLVTRWSGSFRRQDHFNTKYSCSTELFGGDTRVMFESISLDNRKRLWHLLRPYLRKSWELTLNLSETSPEDGETSEQRLEETPARKTEQTEHCYPKRVHRPPYRILKLFLM